MSSITDAIGNTPLLRLRRLGPDAIVVTLAVDSGFKYLSVSPYAG